MNKEQIEQALDFFSTQSVGELVKILKPQDVDCSIGVSKGDLLSGNNYWRVYVQVTDDPEIDPEISNYYAIGDKIYGQKLEKPEVFIYLGGTHLSQLSNKARELCGDKFEQITYVEYGD